MNMQGSSVVRTSDGEKARNIEKLVNQATENRSEPEWGLNMQLCDMVLTKPDESAPLIVRCLRKKLQHEIYMKSDRDEQVISLTLTILDALVKNTNEFCKKVIAKPRNMHALVQLIDDDGIEGNLRKQLDSLVNEWEKEYEYLLPNGLTILLMEIRQNPPKEQPQNQSPLPSSEIMSSSLPRRQMQQMPANPFHLQSYRQQQILTIDQQKDKLARELQMVRHTLSTFQQIVSSMPSGQAPLSQSGAQAFENLKEMQSRIIRLIQHVEYVPLPDVLLIELIDINDSIQSTLAAYSQYKNGGPLPSFSPSTYHDATSPSHQDAPPLDPSHFDPSSPSSGLGDPPTIHDQNSVPIDDLLSNQHSQDEASAPPDPSLAPRRPLFDLDSSSPTTKPKNNLPPLRRRVPEKDTAQTLLDFTAFDAPQNEAPQNEDVDNDDDPFASIS